MDMPYLYYVGEECPRDIYIEAGDDFCINRCQYCDRLGTDVNGKIIKIYCKYSNGK